MTQEPPAAGQQLVWGNRLGATYRPERPLKLDLWVPPDQSTDTAPQVPAGGSQLLLVDLADCVGSVGRREGMRVCGLGEGSSQGDNTAIQRL